MRPTGTKQLTVKSTLIESYKEVAKASKMSVSNYVSVMMEQLLPLIEDGRLKVTTSVVLQDTEGE